MEPSVKHIPGVDEAPVHPQPVMSVLNGSCLMFLWNKKYWEAQEALWLCFPEAHSREAFPTQVLQSLPASAGAPASKLEEHAGLNTELKTGEALLISSSKNRICEEA